MWRSELTEREPDPNKRTNKRNAEAGREGKAKGKEGRKGEKREEREANTEEKQGKGQEEKSKKHTRRRRKGVEPAAASLQRCALGQAQPSISKRLALSLQQAASTRVRKPRNLSLRFTLV